MRRHLAIAVVCAVAAAVPAQAQPAPPPQDPFVASLMPAAAGALVGGAMTFFIMPLIVPSLASGAATVGPAVGTPTLAAIGMAIGGIAGYLMFQ
jgi:hypothetical protein